jgi:hypothetical protein
LLDTCGEALVELEPQPASAAMPAPVTPTAQAIARRRAPLVDGTERSFMTEYHLE